MPFLRDAQLKLFDRFYMLFRLQLGLAVGGLFILLYAVQYLHTGAVIRVAAVGVLVAGASLFVGFMLGFIFCIPRTAKATVAADLSALPVVDGPYQAKRLSDSIETNSNLVDISDWLTKILVGVGLVELNRIPHGLRMLSVFLGPGLRAAAYVSNKESSEAFAFGIVIFFVADGFLIGYIWTRLYFQTALSELTDYARQGKAWEGANKAEQLMAQGKLHEAMRVVDDALDANPENDKAVFIKARILKRLAQVKGKPGDADLLREALHYAAKAAVLRPDKGNTFYNVASYQSLLDGDKAEILANLEKAIGLSPNLRADARADEDFVRFREDAEFKRVTGDAKNV